MGLPVRGLVPYRSNFLYYLRFMLEYPAIWSAMGDDMFVVVILGCAGIVWGGIITWALFKAASLGVKHLATIADRSV